MNEILLPFYSSGAWKHTREAFRKSKQGLCEICLKKGLLVPGEIVHHVKHVTVDNVDDPNITLNWDNLMLLCRDCHADIHRKYKPRYVFDDDGRVIIIED